MPSTLGEIEDWPSAWASESIVASQQAFAGLTFTKHGHENWAVHISERNAYNALQDQMKRDQLAKAGSRLAELLKTLWP